MAGPFRPYRWMPTVLVRVSRKIKESTEKTTSMLILLHIHFCLQLITSPGNDNKLGVIGFRAHYDRSKHILHVEGSTNL